MVLEAHLNGMDDKEIASDLGVSIETVRTRKKRALRKLKLLLNRNAPPPGSRSLSS
jgi:DNA-directed RNA polymerase specialized sigma24 family protein